MGKRMKFEDIKFVVVNPEAEEEASKKLIRYLYELYKEDVIGNEHEIKKP